MRLRLVGAEDGFTMTLAILAMLLVSILVAGALAATKGDLNLTANDLDHKRAYAAAQAGIADYAFHLDRDTTYWTKCVPNPPGAVNQQGSSVNRRSVGQSTVETYAIELLPATGQTSCVVGNGTSMLEQSGPNAGTFRIRSTGYSGDTSQSIVATFKRASFLDYVYFTQLETSDPATYNDQNTINGANSQCTKTIEEGRYGQGPGDLSALIPGSLPPRWCDVISFANGERINGPLHTNDALVVCGTGSSSPRFGRTLADAIEVSSPAPGWYTGSQLVATGCPTGQPSFIGTFFTNAPVLTPPPTNGQLTSVALRFTGARQICLSGTTMTVSTIITPGTPSVCPGTPVSLPSSGVVYVGNGAGCSSAYSPYTAIYPTTQSPCGNVYVRAASGGYSGRLTIAAENDVIVDGNLCRGPCSQSQPTGNGMLGLIANNFVRVYHAYPTETVPPVNGLGTSCGTGQGSSGSMVNRIDAAILAISHSFIVDHYDCLPTNPLGTLTISGAISQKYRGAVGTFQGTVLRSGYSKNYTYDDRLRYEEPPHFLDPVQVAWHVSRQTLDFP